jgi:transposase InsO family protein
MPWRELKVVEERLKFVILASRKERSFRDLCQEFGISRVTGYTWLKRFAAGGSREVFDRSRKPRHSPQKVSAEVEQAVIGLRQRWPDWGAPKLHKMLEREHPECLPVAVRTIHRILSRHDLIRERNRNRPAVHRFERAEPNELWQMDFKGLPGASHPSIGPLSIVDDYSRYVVALRQLGSTKAEGVKNTLERTFQECGLPEAILTDHGTPWWNASGVWGMTELSVWIMQQGVRLLFSGIAHPQTQGKVERMHGALQRAVRERRVRLDEQTWLDEFRHEYNHLRPHEALAMSTPASRWKPSLRQFEGNRREWEYPAEMQIQRLSDQGQLQWDGQRWEISNALRRQTVGIRRVDDRAIVYFCRTPIRELNLKDGTTYPLPVSVFRSLAKGFSSAEGERASDAGPFPPPYPAPDPGSKV